MLIDNQIGCNGGRNIKALVTVIIQAFGLAT